MKTWTCGPIPRTGIETIYVESIVKNEPGERKIGWSIFRGWYWITLWLLCWDHAVCLQIVLRMEGGPRYRSYQEAQGERPRVPRF